MFHILNSRQHVMNPRENTDKIPRELGLRWDSLCDEFEAVWLSGKEPQCEAFLARVPEDQRPTLLSELLLVDFWHRQRTGTLPKLADYTSRFPTYREVVEAAWQRFEVRAAAASPADCRLDETQLRKRSKSTPSRHDGDKGEPRQVADDTLTFIVVKPRDQQALEDRTPSRLFHTSACIDDRYILERELGSGGMGKVFLAHDDRLDRRVAVKIIQQSDDARESSYAHRFDLFTAEAKIGASLKHPAIATVFDYGITQGEPYTVFEYVPGDTLREVLIREGHLPVDEVRHIILQLAKALDYAHRRHVVHRDLKPENIKVSLQGVVTVLDLGLAKQFNLDHDWQFCGTPAYASPEQASGSPGDGRIDQYALGVIAFEMLTGQRPFASRSIHELLDMHKSAVPPSLKTLVPDLPDSIDAAVLRALAKDPNQRFESCERFAFAMGCRETVGVAEGLAARREADIKVKIRVLGQLYPMLDPINSYPSFRRGMSFGRIARTTKAIWLIHRDEIYCWACDQILVLQNARSRCIDIKCEVGPNNRTRVFTLIFEDIDVCRAWYEDLAAFTSEARDFVSVDDPYRIVVSLRRRPRVRFQQLGTIDITSSKPWIAAAVAKLHAAMVGADSITDVETEHIPGFKHDQWRVSGLAMRATDSNGRRELLARWFGTNVSSSAMWMIFLTLSSAPFMFHLILALSAMQGARTSEWDAQSLLPVAVGLFICGWPVATSLMLYFCRWPQLARSASITSAALGVMNGVASVPLFGAVWMLGCLYIAQRIWRLYRFYLDRAQVLGRKSLRRSAVEVVTVLLSSLYLVVAVLVLSRLRYVS